MGAGEVPCSVLLDLNVPTMDGWEFRRRRLAGRALAGVPVIAFTTLGDRLRDAREKLRPVDPLRKPVDSGETAGWLRYLGAKSRRAGRGSVSEKALALETAGA